MAEPSEPAPPAAAPAGGLLVGPRGWIIVIGTVVLEAVGFLVYIHLSGTPGEPVPVSETGGLPAAMQDDPTRAVVLSRLAYVLQGAGPPMELAMAVSLVFNYTEEEKRDPKARNVPSAAVIEAYREYTQNSVDYLKDHLNSYMQTLDPANLRGVNGQRNLRKEIQAFMNRRLQEYLPAKAPAGVDRNRVTDVLLPEWLGPRPME